MILSSIDVLATIDCWVHRKVPTGYGFYSYEPNNRRCQVGYDYNCVIEPCKDNSTLSSIEQLPTGGWLIHTNLTSVALQRLENNVWISFTREGANYVFLEPEKLVIDECDTYPQLEGVQLELNGITTDANGNYTVFVPPMQ